MKTMTGFKKIIALILIVSMALSITTCVSAEEKIQITWMVWGHARNIEIKMEAMKETFPELFEKYELVPIVVGSSPADVADRLRLDLAARAELPDIAQLSSNFLPEFVEAGVLADLSEEYTDEVKDSLMDGMLNLVTFDEKQMGYVYALGLLTWVYRKDLFEEAGIDVDAIKTEDDFIEAGKKLHEKFPDSYIFNFTPSMALDRFNWIVSGNGAKYVDENGEYIFDQDPGVRKALESLKKLYDSGVCVNINEWTPDWEQGLANGTIASSLIASWIKDSAFLSNYAPDDAGKWGVKLWPDFAGANGGGSETGGNVIFVLNDAPHKQEAIEVLNAFHFTNEGNLASFKASGGSLTPILRDAYHDPEVMKPDPYWGTEMWEMEAEAMKSFRLFPYTPAAALENKIIAPYLEKCLAGELSIDETLTSINNDLKIQIGNPYQLGK